MPNPPNELSRVGSYMFGKLDDTVKRLALRGDQWNLRAMVQVYQTTGLPIPEGEDWDAAVEWVANEVRYKLSDKLKFDLGFKK